MFGDKRRDFKIEVPLFFFIWIVDNWCHCNKPTDCQVLVCKLFLFIYHVLCLNFQAIVIIAKLSFWVNKPLLPSATEAFDQYKQKGYVQKLKTDITPDIKHFGQQDLVTLLYRQVTPIDGTYFI